MHGWAYGPRCYLTGLELRRDVLHVGARVKPISPPLFRHPCFATPVSHPCFSPRTVCFLLCFVFFHLRLAGFNPWRAPGSAPVIDPCGQAGGKYKQTPVGGDSVFVTVNVSGQVRTLSVLSLLLSANTSSCGRVAAVLLCCSCSQLPTLVRVEGCCCAAVLLCCCAAVLPLLPSTNTGSCGRVAEGNPCGARLFRSGVRDGRHGFQGPPRERPQHGADVEGWHHTPCRLGYAVRAPTNPKVSVDRPHISCRLGTAHHMLYIKI